jgi:hypothetical protein
MPWWVPLVIAGAQMAKGEYDKQQAEKKAGERSSSGGGYTPSFNPPDFDGSKYMQQDDSVIREPEMKYGAGTARTPYFQPEIGGGVDSRLQQLRMMEAQGGYAPTPLPQEASLPPQWFAPGFATPPQQGAPMHPKYYQGDNSVIRGR